MLHGFQTAGCARQQLLAESRGPCREPCRERGMTRCSRWTGLWTRWWTGLRTWRLSESSRLPWLSKHLSWKDVYLLGWQLRVGEPGVAWIDSSPRYLPSLPVHLADFELQWGGERHSWHSFFCEEWVAEVSTASRPAGKFQSAESAERVLRVLRKWSSGGPEDYRTAGRRSAVRPRPTAVEAVTSADSQLILAVSSRRVRTTM